MMFLIRSAFWLSVVILLLPGDPERGTEAPSVTLFEALGAARAAVADLSQFCERNPDVCATGQDVVDVIADKARYNIQQVQAYLESRGEPADTLTPEDTVVPWRDPGRIETVAAIGG